MPETILNYFADGNTARGYVNLFQSNIDWLNRLYILKGGPGTGKSTLMKELGTEWFKIGYDVEYIHSSLNSASLVGVIVPKLRVGIVDGTEPHFIEPKAPGAIEEFLDIGLAWDSSKLIKSRETIISLSTQKRGLLKKACLSFQDALNIHDEWESIYIKNMDFTKANQLTETIIEKIIGNKNTHKNSLVRHRFLGAATADGPIDYVNNLTSTIEKRYLIKGRPGTGKSTLLRKLSERAEHRGFDIEVYHCGFDPNSLDMVIIRELDIAIFDSTSPHEYFSERENDEIIDMYQSTITPGTDEKYSVELETIIERYKSKITEATGFLFEARQFHLQLKELYSAATDFEKVDRLKNSILINISNLEQSNF